MTIMRAALVLLLSIACGGPALQNVPHPNNAAMAGGFAAAAAAITLASPDAATKKPEKNVYDDRTGVQVKENVPSDVLDRADQARDAGSGAAPAPDAAKTAKRKGPTPRLPSPRDAARETTVDDGSP